MANNVFANGMEISCKAADGKSVCCFPDVCFTPPQTPATPPGVPIPYPNTAFAKDTTKGSRTVKISRKEVMLRNKSYFKTSTGDEAGCAPKKGIMTSKIKGKAYFTRWSMDVKFEGKNVVRNLDMTTHNHGSVPSNTSPWPYLDGMAMPPDDHPCNQNFKDERAACEGLEARNADGSLNKSATRRALCEHNDDARACREARACRLAPYSEGCCPQSSGTNCSQPHHLVEDHWVKENDAFPWYRSLREDGNERPTDQERANGVRTDEDAPCVCSRGDKWREEHGEFHVIQCAYEQTFMPGRSRENQGWDYKSAKLGCIMAHSMVFDGRCDEDCLEAQLDAFYGDDDERPLNPPERIPSNDDSARGWTEREALERLDPKPLTQNLPIPPSLLS